MLVDDGGGAVDRPYLRLLRRRGEFGPLRTTGELTATAGDLLGPEVDVTRTGSMACLRAKTAS
jgi:hypothetical protein